MIFGAKLVIVVETNAFYKIVAVAESGVSNEVEADEVEKGIMWEVLTEA